MLQIQNFSVHDGNGIRSIIFFAGCPLRCKWCANPEGLTPDFKLAFYQKSCINCGACLKVCPVGLRRNECFACGKCAATCPTGSRKMMVFEMSEDEIVREIQPQMAYYRNSGGGVTFSGGEATEQKDSFRSLARRLYDMGIDLALETCGYFEFEEVSDALGLFDTIFFDIKTMDEKSHIENTGVSNRKILENFKKVANLNAKITVRVPVIEGFNAGDDEIRAIRSFVTATAPHADIELLPYHKYGEIKYEALGLKIPSPKFRIPSGYPD